MNSNEIKTHGGNRAGSGRPKNPESVRSQLAKAALGEKGIPYNHTRTAYEVWSSTFIETHMHDDAFHLYCILHRSPDKSSRALSTRGEKKSFLSLNLAVQIAKLPMDEQMDFVTEYCGHLIRKFVVQYKEDTGIAGDRARELAQAMEL